MDIDYDKLHAPVEELSGAVKALRDFHASKKLTAANQLYKRDAKKLERLERRLAESQSKLVAALPPTLVAAEKEESVAFKFDEFFTSVADGYIKAQRNLDAASVEYLKAVSGQPHVLPSIFKIPKLAAEVKFALDKVEGQAVQFIFFKNQTTSETRNEQTVNFEIVAAPPPHGMVAPPPAALVAPVIVTAVFSKAGRAEIFDAIRNLPGGANTDKALDRPNLLQDPDAVIIIAVDGDRRLLLAAANQAAPGNVGVWYFETEPPALVVARKFGGATDVNIQRLRDLVARLGEAQKKFLSQPA